MQCADVPEMRQINYRTYGHWHLEYWRKGYINAFKAATIRETMLAFQLPFLVCAEEGLSKS